MDQLSKIDYMIKTLYLAKDEIEYAQKYNLKKKMMKQWDVISIHILILDMVIECQTELLSENH